jgi:hypothetical protein
VKVPEDRVSGKSHSQVLAPRTCCRQLTGCTMLLSGGSADQLSLIQLTELHQAVHATAQESKRRILYKGTSWAPGQSVANLESVQFDCGHPSFLSGGHRRLFPGVKRAEREDAYSPPIYCRS